MKGCAATLALFTVIASSAHAQDHKAVQSVDQRMRFLAITAGRCHAVYNLLGDYYSSNHLQAQAIDGLNERVSKGFHEDATKILEWVVKTVPPHLIQNYTSAAQLARRRTKPPSTAEEAQQLEELQGLFCEDFDEIWYEELGYRAKHDAELAARSLGAKAPTAATEDKK